MKSAKAAIMPVRGRKHGQQYKTNTNSAKNGWFNFEIVNVLLENIK